MYYLYTFCYLDCYDLTSNLYLIFYKLLIIKLTVKKINHRLYENIIILENKDAIAFPGRIIFWYHQYTIFSLVNQVNFDIKLEIFSNFTLFFASYSFISSLSIPDV